MNKIKIVLAVVVMIVCGSAFGQDLAALTARYGEAAEAYTAKRFAAAVPIFEEVISAGQATEGAEQLVSDSKKYLPDAIYKMGGAAFMGGKLDDALASFTKAAKLADEFGNAAVLNNARMWIGRTVLKQGADAFNAKDYATAATIFQKGYDSNPNDTQVAMNLAMSYIGLADYAKGNEIYRAVMALGSQNGRFAEAAAQAKTKFVEDNTYRAVEAAKAGKFEDAVAATDDIIAAVPTDATAHLTRLQAYNSLKNYAKVAELGESAAAAQTADEPRSEVWFLVASAFTNQSNWAKAMEAYRKVTVGPNVAAAKAKITELQKVAQ